MTAFKDLNPDFILDVIQSQGFKPEGQLIQLNSYENRVYEIPLLEGSSLVAKFYRPNRWSKEQLLEEHQTLAHLKKHNAAVVYPFELSSNLPQNTLGYASPFHYAIYPKHKGKLKADLNEDQLFQLGDVLGHIHQVNQSLKLKHRLSLNSQTFGDDQLPSIFEGGFLPDDLFANLRDILHDCLDLMDPLFQQNLDEFPIHGDCHLGNVIWNQDDEPTLVDFDDMVLAPAVQDVWMLFHGSDAEKEEQQEPVFEGYEQHLDFDHNSLNWIEVFRTLRMIKHAAWIGERYDEAIFQQAFPYYPERKYWENLLLNFKEQLFHLQSAHLD